MLGGGRLLDIIGNSQVEDVSSEEDRDCLGHLKVLNVFWLG